jgi:hypothetical protein
MPAAMLCPFGVLGLFVDTSLHRHTRFLLPLIAAVSTVQYQTIYALHFLFELLLP